MADTTLILHGWSDCSASFRSLESFLVRDNPGDVASIYYADYESREDAITYEDVVDGLQEELRRRGLVDGEGHGSFDVVVHSTGGLVIRHWIWRYYGDRIEECPVENLVMLAPANFGSPLAHRGKSLLGRAFRGRWKIGDMLEVGRNLLNGLELASAYQWELAHRDLLGSEPFYGDDRIRLTVLVGVDDYDGLRGWVNKPGTDGTVVIAGTTVDSVKLSLDFCDPERPLRWRRDTAHGDFAFGVLPGLDHGTVVDAFAEDFSPDDGRTREGARLVRRHVLRALDVDSAEAFREHREAVADLRRRTYGIDVGDDDGAEPERSATRWQQFLLRAVDDQDQPVRDFTLDFFVHRGDTNPEDAEPRRGMRHGPRMLTEDERNLSRRANRLMTSHFHTYSRDSSYRRILVDPRAVDELLPEDHVLAMRMFVPEVEDGISYDTDHILDVVIHDPAEASDAPSFFYPNTTTLVELRVDRVTDYVTVGTEPREH